MKKKALASLLLAAAMVFSLVGCGSKKSGPSGNVDENGVTTDEITLSFWHYEDEIRQYVSSS